MSDATNKNRPDDGPSDFSELDDVRVRRVLDRLAELPAEFDEPTVDDDRAATAQSLEPRQLVPGERLGHFLVRRFHGRGGLGQVWVVHDELLGREVALKVVRPELESKPRARQRFLHEAQIAGGLQHPNIVPVYEFGVAPGGRAYYAMKFVPGRTLADAVREFHRLDAASPESNLRFRELLRAFGDVCRAMAFAHEQSVVHRDLKPSNIMWGEHGEAVVLDWGVAKRLDSAAPDPTASPSSPPVTTSATLIDAAAGSTDKGEAALVSTPHDERLTHTGDLLGTLPFMSPEQADGRQSRVDAKSDIYSLGAILYVILTNRLPFDEPDRARLLDRILERTPPAPREVRPAVPRALDAICRKAMARARDDRYATAAALARDIENWLADEPVAAYIESPPERIGRWARRHRATATAAVVGLAILSVVSVVAAIEIRAASHETERQRIKADAGFKQAFDAVNQLVGLINDDRLKELPGLRHELFETADRFLNEFVAARGDDPKLSEDIGDAYQSLANLRHARGEFAASLETYREARTLREKWLEAHPDRTEPRRKLAQTLHNIAVSLVELGRRDEALAEYDQASTQLERLLKSDPENAAVLRLLALNYNGRAAIQQAARRIEESTASLEKARGILEPLVERDPADTQALRALAGVYFNLARVRDAERDFPASLELHEHARDIRQRLVQGDPGSSSYRRDLAASFSSVGLQLGRLDRVDESIESHRQSIALREDLLRSNPNDAALYKELASSHINFAVTLSNAGRDDDAIAATQAAIELGRTALDKEPTAAEFRRSVVNACYNLAHLHLRRGQPHDAAAAIAERRRLAPDDPNELFDVAIQLAGCASVIGDDADALNADERAERERFMDQSVEALRATAAAGFKSWDRARSDKRLLILRDHAGFKAILERATR